MTALRARALLQESDTGDVFDRLVHLATMALRAPVAVLAAVHGPRLLPVSQAGVPAPWTAARELLVQWTQSRLSATGEAFVVEDLAGPPVDRPKEFSRMTFCGVPVLVDGEVVGVLAVGDALPRRWTPDDAALLHDLAAALLRSLGLMAERYPQPAQPTAPNAQGSRYRGLFEESRMPLFVMSQDGVLIEVNRALVELLGRSREELHGASIRDLSDDAGGVDRLLQELAGNGAGAEAELPFRHASGAELICVISGGTYATPDGMVVYHGSIRDVTQQKRMQDELVRTAFQDPLTGLANRLVFLDRLDRLLRHSKRRIDDPFAVLFLDLDNFKQINDLYGHLVGDQLLVAVARRLESCVRQEDTIARIGGDEFGVLLDTIPDGLTVTLIVDRIRDALAQPVEADGLDMGTTASIGIAMSASGYEHAHDLLRDADAAMYRAKASGRNDYVIFDSDMHDAALHQRQLEDDLRAAMSGDQLSVHYHPVVDLKGGAVTGLEALVRWSHPTHGVLLPSQFIPLAERTGLIVEIGWWVLREACRQLRSWQLDYPDSAFRLTISVNLSAKQFVHPTLVHQIDNILDETGIDPSLLRLDLTEAVVMQNANLASSLMNQLRERGIEICIDDFGTGYTSIQQLRLFPISGLKIDRSFIDLLNDNGDDEVVQSILALGSSMAIDVIAEGVETPGQLQQLRRLGTRFAQGFLFSLPLDPKAVSALLQQTQG